MRFGVRIDAPGRPFSDFQTAQNVVQADGQGKSTVTSKRHFLADARFLVGLESESITLLTTIEAALRSPRYTLSLGRKSYPLSLPPYLPKGSLRENMELEEVLRSEPWRYLSDREVRSLPDKLILLVESADGEMSLADQPRNFSNRTFGMRRATLVDIDMPKEVLSWSTYQN